jgi:hypothetical protein
MTKRIDLTGKRFGRWTVLHYAGNQKWFCVCDSGTARAVDGWNLRSGQSKSCGCLRSELTQKRFMTHGMSKTSEYWIWRAMKQRCLNPRATGFEFYGGREIPITVYEDWLSFVPWFADAGSRPPGCSLDRIDNNGNYEPGNIRWTDARQQAQNRRPRRATATATRARPKRPPDDDLPPF